MFSFKNLTVGFNKAVLENISGELKTGSITFLIGPNGSGKTTLLKTLSQILYPLSGIISFESFERKAPIYLPSEMSLQAGLTGNDLLDIYGVRNSKWFNDSLLESLEIKNLLQFRLNELSAGERQRILLCAVLSNSSSVVFLDEPLNHLDWNFSLRLKNILCVQSEQGRTFLISNHDLNWSLNWPRIESTETWVLFQKSIFLKNSTESVLNDIKLQEVFKIKMNVIQNKFISLSEL